MIFYALTIIAFSSTSSPQNLTEILSGVWNITLYSIDQFRGKEIYQNRIYYSLELKNSIQNDDLYGFLYSFYGKTKEENDISINLRKKDFSNKVYSIFVSTSDVSAFREYAVMNISSTFNNILTGSGKTYLNDHFSFLISFPNYAEVVIYSQTTKHADIYRGVKVSFKDNNLTKWRVVPIILMALISVFKSFSQQHDRKQKFVDYGNY